MTSETDPQMDPKGQPGGVIDGAIAIAKGMGTVWKQTFRRDNTESYPTEIVAASGAFAHRPPPAQHARERAREVHRLRAVRVRVSGGRHLGGGG